MNAGRPLRLGVAWRLAIRDLRGSWRGFGVFLASIALGVAAITAVGNLDRGVGDALRHDARRILGGDFTLEQASVPLSAGDLASLVPPGSRVSETIRTNAIARTGSGAKAADARALAVSLKAVDARHPLLGAVDLDPPQPLERAFHVTAANAAAATDGSAGGIVVEPAFLSRLGVAVGDRVRLGDGLVRVAAVLVREPDRLGAGLSLGPRVLLSIPTMQRLGVLQPGALVRYEYRVVVPAGTDVAAWTQAVQESHPDAGWRLQTASQVQPQAARLTDRLATFLTLAGLATLITGGLGIGLAVHNHLARRIATIATLKCLGAPGQMIFAIFLTQVAALAAVGTACGLLAGQLLPLALRLLPANTLPVLPAYGLYAGPLALAGACGMLTAVAFATWPLAMAREVTPANLFRTASESGRRRPRARYLVLLGVVIAALAGLAILGVPRPQVGLWFVLGTAACLVGLAILGRLFLWALGHLAGRGGFAWRLALGTLKRPGSGAIPVVVALGTGLAVLTMVGLLQHGLEAAVEESLPSRAPSTLFIDLQPAQRGAFERDVATAGGRVLQVLPSLRARVVRIKDTPVDAALLPSDVRWTVTHDRGLTYLENRPQRLDLVAGTWWPSGYDGPPLLSLDAEVARGYGVGVGDSLTFNVLGRAIDARIASLRPPVDWSSGRLDFMFIMSPGLISKAPHTLAASIDIPPDGESRLLNTLATAMPNVTPISIRDIVAQLTTVLGKIGFAVDVVAAVTLAAGLLVLVAAVAAAHARHLYESVLLKVLGATRAVILRSFLVEYGVMGAVAAATGGLLGSLGAWAIAVFAMHLPWRFDPWIVAGIALTAVGLALLVGGLGLLRVLGRPAAPVLRMS